MLSSRPAAFPRVAIPFVVAALMLVACVNDELTGPQGQGEAAGRPARRRRQGRIFDRPRPRIRACPRQSRRTRPCRLPRCRSRSALACGAAGRPAASPCPMGTGRFVVHAGDEHQRRRRKGNGDAREGCRARGQHGGLLSFAVWAPTTQPSTLLLADRRPLLSRHRAAPSRATDCSVVQRLLHRVIEAKRPGIVVLDATSSDRARAYWSIILRITLQAVSWQSVHDAP